MSKPLHRFCFRQHYQLYISCVRDCIIIISAAVRGLTCSRRFGKRLCVIWSADLMAFKIWRAAAHISRAHTSILVSPLSMATRKCWGVEQLLDVETAVKWLSTPSISRSGSSAHTSLPIICSHRSMSLCLWIPTVSAWINTPFSVSDLYYAWFQ